MLTFPSLGPLIVLKYLAHHSAIWVNPLSLFPRRIIFYLFFKHINILLITLIILSFV